MVEFDDDEGYVYHAVIKYLQPTTRSVGVRALSLTEAREILEAQFGELPSFEIDRLEVAPDDVARALERVTHH